MIVVGKGCASRDDSPSTHTDTKVNGWPDSSQEHVGWDSGQQVSHIQDGDADVVLVSHETEMFFNVVETCLGQSISIP